MRFNIFLVIIERKFFSFFHRPLDSSLFLRGSSFLEGTMSGLQAAMGKTVRKVISPRQVPWAVKGQAGEYNCLMPKKELTTKAPSQKDLITAAGFGAVGSYTE
ncbi:MAG: hypothetical protein IT292_09705 [Deltaproteobacteria bacterium]|nr:hypothetical protein [Deltaproteobacteria bacterium]